MHSVQPLFAAGQMLQTSAADAGEGILEDMKLCPDGGIVRQQFVVIFTQQGRCSERQSSRMWRATFSYWLWPKEWREKPQPPPHTSRSEAAPTCQCVILDLPNFF